MSAARPGPGQAMAAVALLSARAALRSRLVHAAFLVLVLATAALAATATGDGTPRGRMQAYLSWSAGFAALVLPLTTVFLSTALAGGLRAGSLTQVLAAPLRREALLVAWWAGLVAVVAALVAAAFLAIGLGAVGMVWAAASDEQPALRSALVARAVARPPPLDPRALRVRAEAEYERIARDPSRVEGLSPEEAIFRLEDALRSRSLTVPRQRRLVWQIDGVRPGPETEAISLRFRYRVQAAEDLGGGPPSVRGAWTLRAAGAPGVLERAGSWVGGEMHELAAPAAVFAGSERIEVSYTNLAQGPAVVEFPEDGVALVYPAGGAAGNLLRAALVLFGRLAFLTAAGVALAALLDGKVAALAALFVLLVGLAHGFLGDGLHPGLFGALDGPLRGLLEGVLRLLPDLGRDDLPGALAAGLQVDDAAVGHALGAVALLRGGGALALGAFLFARRELGAA